MLLGALLDDRRLVRTRTKSPSLRVRSHLQSTDLNPVRPSII
jgi:hypothetical protein